MVSMRHADKVVSDFEQLVKLLPPDAVASLLRSTVPLVDFWRTPASRLAQLSAIIGVILLPPTDLCFEYPVGESSAGSMSGVGLSRNGGNERASVSAVDPAVR